MVKKKCIQSEELGKINFNLVTNPHLLRKIEFGDSYTPSDFEIVKKILKENNFGLIGKNYSKPIALIFGCIEYKFDNISSEKKYRYYHSAVFNYDTREIKLTLLKEFEDGLVELTKKKTNSFEYDLVMSDYVDYIMESEETLKKIDEVAKQCFNISAEERLLIAIFGKDYDKKLKAE